MAEMYQPTINIKIPRFKTRLSIEICLKKHAKKVRLRSSLKRVRLNRGINFYIIILLHKRNRNHLWLK